MLIPRFITKQAGRLLCQLFLKKSLQ